MLEWWQQQLAGSIIPWCYRSRRSGARRPDPCHEVLRRCNWDSAYEVLCTRRQRQRFFLKTLFAKGGVIYAELVCTRTCGSCSNRFGWCCWGLVGLLVSSVESRWSSPAVAADSHMLNIFVQLRFRTKTVGIIFKFNRPFQLEALSKNRILI